MDADQNPTKDKQLETLRETLLSELDQLIVRKRELNGQMHRVAVRIRTIQSQLGLPPQNVRTRKHEARTDCVRRLLHSAKGPMSIASIMREIEAHEQKSLGSKSTWNFLHRHPTQFVHVGQGLWDLREKWSESDLAAELKRRGQLAAVEELQKGISP